jgi:hypothetical protein
MQHAAYRWRRWRKACEWLTDDKGRLLDTPYASDADPCELDDIAALLARVRDAMPANDIQIGDTH